MKTMFPSPVRHLLFCDLARSLQVGLLLAIPCAAFSQAPAPSTGTTSGSETSNTGTVQKPTASKPTTPPTTTSPTSTITTPATTTQIPATGQNQTQTQRPGVPIQNSNTIIQPGTPIAQSPNFTGTIGTFETNGFSLTTQGGASTSFHLGEDTLFFDSEGRPLPRERFTSKTPATVYYTRSGNDLVATRVVATAKEAPAIFTVGTITEVSPGVLVIEQPIASSTPVRYVNNQTTNYVDQNGEPVRPEMVKTGMPVKVFYTKVGDTLLASKVEVQMESADSGLPKPAVKETTTSTTTTTVEKKP